jgi:hypothetical protein
MPYFQLRDSLNGVVELQGNSAADLQAAISKHGGIAQPPLANAWVAAFFTRRSHQISKQKAEQVGDEEAADAAYERMVEAEQAEGAARAAYLAAVAAMGNAPAAAASTAEAAGGAQQQQQQASGGGLYADVKQDRRDAATADGAGGDAATEEDDFM